MGDVSWWGEERPKLNCLDYSIGRYKPVSFKTKLKWTITHSIHAERLFIAAAKLYSNPGEKAAQLIVRSTYGFGRMRVLTDGLPHDFEFRIETNDPEEAMYLAEKELIDRATGWRDFYSDLLGIVN